MIRSTRVLLLVLVLVAIGTPPATVRAQVAVIDPGNIAQAVILVSKAVATYSKLVDQYETLLRMSQALPGMGRYRTVPIAASEHDPSRWTYGAPWLTALNLGDPRGERYAQVARTLAPTAEALA